MIATGAILLGLWTLLRAGARAESSIASQNADAGGFSSFPAGGAEAGPGAASLPRSGPVHFHETKSTDAGGTANGSTSLTILSQSKDSAPAGTAQAPGPVHTPWQPARAAVLTAAISRQPSAIRQTIPSLRMRVTAYCPCPICCGKYADGMTASGEPVTADGGRFAASPDLPFGALVDVPGYGRVRVLDRMPRPKAGSGLQLRAYSLRPSRLDVFFPTHGEAKAWGVKWLNVRVMTDRNGNLMDGDAR